MNNIGGKVAYRDDRTKLTLTELWDAAQEAMNRVSAAATTPLIAANKAHDFVFLKEWKYSDVSKLTKAKLDTAWTALKDPASLKTLLATFH